MPISTDISDLWWLRQDKPESSIPALALGAQIAQRKIEMEKNAEAIKMQTAFRMMDYALEKERNDIAAQTFKAKQETDVLRARGMSEIGNFLSEAIKGNKLTDPETQAGFWNLTSRYAPFITQEMVNSIWDNNFGAAMQRKDRAAGRGANSTITERDWETWRDLKRQERTAIDEEHLAEVQQERRMFEQMKGISDPSARPRIETITDDTGEAVKVLVGPNGKTIRVLPKVDTSKLSQVEAVLLKKEAQSIDPESIAYMKKGKDGEWSFDSAAYQADLKRLEEKYTKKKTGASAVTPAPAATPAPFEFEFNPTNKTLIPIR